jgi:hypothetical protein
MHHVLTLYDSQTSVHAVLVPIHLFNLTLNSYVVVQKSEKNDELNEFETS